MRYRWAIVSLTITVAISIGVAGVLIATHVTPDEAAKLAYYETEQARLAAAVSQSHIFFLDQFEDLAGPEAATNLRSGVLGKLEQLYGAKKVSAPVYLEANGILDQDSKMRMASKTDLPELELDELLQNAKSIAAAKRNAFKKETLKQEAARLTQEIAELQIKNIPVEVDRSEQSSDKYADVLCPAEVYALLRWVQNGGKAPPPPPPPSTGGSWTLYDLGFEKWPVTGDQTFHWYLNRIGTARYQPRAGQSQNELWLEVYRSNNASEIARKRARISAIKILLEK